MPLSLEQYAAYLDRQDHQWPVPPRAEPTDLAPRLEPLEDIRAVTWNIYGTLVAIRGGGLVYDMPESFEATVALEKTIQQFKMWNAMTRKPGRPSEYLAEIYRTMLRRTLLERGSQSSSGHPEIKVEMIWQAIVGRLQQNQYTFDTRYFGDIHAYSQKIAYFFHTCFQGIGPYADALATVRQVKASGYLQGIVADGQCFTPLQLLRALRRQGPVARMGDVFETELQAYSCELRARKPAGRLYRFVLDALEKRGIGPTQVLHVSNDWPGDLEPAKSYGMKTALFAGDAGSLRPGPLDVHSSASGPDAIVVSLPQLADVLGLGSAEG